MKNSVILLALFTALAAQAQVSCQWVADAARPAAVEYPAYQGETLWLEPSFTSYGEAVDLSGAAATLYWQTNGMGSAWWSKPAAVATGQTSSVRAVFAPTNDVGAAAYTFFIGLASTGGISYRAYGSLAMRASPGFSPSEAPAPDYYPTLAGELAPYVSPLLSGLTSGVPAQISAAIAPLATTQHVAAAYYPLAGGDLAAGATVNVVQIWGGGLGRTVLGSQYLRFTAASDNIDVQLFLPNVQPNAQYTGFLATRDDVAAATAPLATTQHVAAATAPKLDRAAGTASNLTLCGWVDLPQSTATNLVLRVWSSNAVIFASEVYQ